MNIIFLWDSNLNCKNMGVMLSGKYSIAYDCATKNLCIKRNNHYVNEFWGGKIQDCFAIVGDNGSGKTVLVNCIMEHIERIKSGINPDRDFLTIGEDETDGKLLIYYTEGLARIVISEQNGIRYKLCQLGDIKKHYLMEYEVAYFHNALSRYDYFVESRCNYDFALGAMMRQHHKKTYEMHYDSLEKDVVKNYYDHEIFRIITFIYDDKFLDKIENDSQDKSSIKFPRPKLINIHIADENYSREYIEKETKNLRIYKEGGISEEDIYRFRRNVDKIARFRDKWASYTVKNLVLNCYKTLYALNNESSYCIGSPQVFFDACSFLENIEPDEADLYECAFEITKNLRYKLEGDEISRKCVDLVEEFIQWLKSNRSRICEFESKLSKKLIIRVNRDTKKFMIELISLYSKMRFEFPFYEFSFDVSTGEMSFLTLFSNLYLMVNGNKSEVNVYNYPKLKKEVRSVLLIFDEADISMHPRWQRMYMKWLVDFCKQVFENWYVKIIVTTHSPILLSDFPANSVLYLEKDENAVGGILYNQKEKKTFGSNVHVLYLDSFFLEEQGTMGAFAEQKINEIAEILLQESVDKEKIDYENIDKKIDYIGEEIISSKLKEALNRGRRNRTVIMSGEEKLVLKDTLMKLREQRNYIDRLIKELEDNINDKNRY